MFRDGVLTVVSSTSLANDIGGPTRLTPDRVTKALQLPTVLQCCQDAAEPLPRIAARRASRVFPSLGRGRIPCTGRYHCSKQSPKTLRESVHHPAPFFSTPKSCWLANAATIKAQSRQAIRKSTRELPQCNSHALPSENLDPVVEPPWLRQPTVPSNQFQALLTLVSEFFSTFPHGTCSLSVSLWYLALCEIYHTFNGALPSSATLQHRNICRGATTTKVYGVLTLSDADFHQTYPCVRPRRIRITKLQFEQLLQVARFKIWALPGSFATTKGIIVIFFSSL